MRPSLWHPCRNLSVTSSALHRASPMLPVSFSLPLARVFTGWSGSEDVEIAKPTDCAFSWKLTPRFGLGCLLSLGTLRRIRWPLQPRSRDPLTAFGDGRTAEWHSRVTLGLRPDLSFSHWSLAGIPDVPFARRTRPQVSPTTVHFELGPRSLDPAAVFAARMPSLFETRRRLTTSATATTTCGQPNHRLSFPRRDDGLDHLPFLLASRRSLLSSDAWRAALRPLSTIPVLVPPGYPSLPNRDIFESAPPPPSCPVGA